jgi:hypothetical protein
VPAPLLHDSLLRLTRQVISRLPAGLARLERTSMPGAADADPQRLTVTLARARAAAELFAYLARAAFTAADLLRAPAGQYQQVSCRGGAQVVLDDPPGSGFPVGGRVEAAGAVPGVLAGQVVVSPPARCGLGSAGWLRPGRPSAGWRCRSRCRAARRQHGR